MAATSLTNYLTLSILTHVNAKLSIFLVINKKNYINGKLFCLNFIIHGIIL